MEVDRQCWHYQADRRARLSDSIIIPSKQVLCR